MYCFSVCFQSIFFVLVFRSLIMMCPGMNFFRFILFIIHSASWSVGWFCPVWRIFSHYFFEYSFNPTLFLLPFWDSSVINVGSFVTGLQVLETLFFIFSLFSPWVNSTDLSSTSLFLSSVISLYYRVHSVSCSIPVIFQFCKFHLVLFLEPLFLWWTF